MKQCMKRLMMFTAVAATVAGMVFRVTAAESQVTFRRGEEWFLFSPGSGYSDSDLFEGFKNVLPGDTLKQTITITNKNRDTDGVRIWLRAEPHTSGNPLSYNEVYENTDGKDQGGIPGKRDETVDIMEDFLSKLTLRVYRGNRCISETTAKEGGLTENVYLGTIGSGDSINLRVELEVPVELDNRYADRVGEVDWIFTAEVYKDPGSPDAPKTGDTIVVAWLFAMMSGGMLAYICFVKRRNL